MSSRLLRTVLLGSAAALVLFGVLALTSSPELRRGDRFVDPDGYMRLVRVRRLAETGAWFDSEIPRSNWPDGEVLHWTRPLDVVLLAAVAVLTPALGFDAALHQAGVWIAPILLLGTFAATFWAGLPLVPPGGRGFLGLILLAQPAVLSYSLPARPDHHSLILLLFAVTLGFAVRAFAEPGTRGWARGLGISAAAGLWVSPEFLLPVGLLLASGVISWLLLDTDQASQNRRWTGALFGALLVFLLVERGPGFFEVEYDRLSLVHLAVAGIAWGFWKALDALRSRMEGWALLARASAAGLLGVAGLALMAAAFPSFFGGPMSEVRDPLVRSWLGQITELQPILLPASLQGLGLLLANAGSALLALPFLAWTLGRGDAPRAPRLLLLLGLAVCLGLALFQARWVTYVELMAVPAVAELVARARRGIGGDAATGAGPLLARASLSTALVAGPLLLGAALVVRSGTVTGERQHVAGGCDPERIAAFLDDAPWNGRPRTVAAYMDLGPTLLYRTDHRVLATPYHRNEQGLRKVYDLLAGTDPGVARGRLEAWEIDLVLICPGRDGTVFPALADGAPTLYGRLVAGDVPEWLTRIPVEVEGGSVLLFETSEPTSRGFGAAQRPGSTSDLAPGRDGPLSRESR